MNFMNSQSGCASAAVPRRQKLDSIDPSHLLLAARAALTGASFNRSASYVVRVLGSAGARGSEEAAWLLETLTHSDDDDGDGFPATKTPGSDAFWLWMAKRMSDPSVHWVNEPRTLYYRWLALSCVDEAGSGLDLLRRSAEGGFAPAMAELGNALTDVLESMTWLRKAADLNDPDGLYFLSYHSESMPFELRLASAQQGHAGSMDALAFGYESRLGPAECAMWRARCMLLRGWRREGLPGLEEALRRMDRGETWNSDDVQVVCNVGRELEGCEQFWDDDRTLDPVFVESIKWYLRVMHSARRAALQAVSALRQRFGLPRDVAVLIGQLVYQSRRHAATWFRAATRMEMIVRNVQHKSN